MSGRRKSRKSSRLGKRKASSEPLRFLQPSYVFLNANVVTMDPGQPSAQAVAIHRDQIAAVGNNAEISKLAGPETSVTNLKKATVLPGFIDCHVHLIDYGFAVSGLSLDLHGVRSIEEMKKRVSEKSMMAPSRVEGHGWDQEIFVERRYPSRADLDEVAPEKPVILRRVCGHICVANSIALKLAGIDRNTPDPAGGSIDRDSNGEPTGILRETAVNLVEEGITRPGVGQPEGPEEYEKATTAACEKAVEAGLTGVHCVLSSERELRALLKLKAEGRLPIRFYLLLPVHLQSTASQLGLRTGFGDDWIRIGGVKIFTDGSLGARTAALEAPYSDDPLNRGIPTYTQEQLDGMVAEAHRSDLQLAIHAIGDRAIRMALEAVKKARDWMAKKELRHRIEHASVLTAELIQEMKDLGVIASVQPHFVASDTWVERRLGTARARSTYPFQNLLREGVTVVAGSDCPVDPIAPLTGIAAAVDRAEQALSIEDALALYTRSAAYASFDESRRGTISPGKLADLVVLKEDPRKAAPSEIPNIQVLLTMVGGRVVYRSGS